MHSQTGKEASDILLERGMITIRKEGRKKILSISTKGKSIVEKMIVIKEEL